MALVDSRLKLADFIRNRFSVVVDPGESFENIQTPAYWVHVAAKLRPRDIIEIFAADNSWFGELVVLSAGKGGARVAVLRKVELTASEVKGKPAPKVEESGEGAHFRRWNNKTQQHEVLRRDGSVVLEAFNDKAAADDRVAELNTL